MLRKPSDQHTLNAKISRQQVYPRPCSDIVSAFGDRSAINDNLCAISCGARMQNVPLMLGTALGAHSLAVTLLRGVTPSLLTTRAATLSLVCLIVAASCSPLRQRSRCQRARVAAPPTLRHRCKPC